MKCMFVMVLMGMFMATGAAGKRQVLQKITAGATSGLAKVNAGVAKTALAAGIAFGLSLCTSPTMADDCANHQPHEQVPSSEDATRDAPSSKWVSQYADKEWHFRNFDLDNEPDSFKKFIRSFIVTSEVRALYVNDTSTGKYQITAGRTNVSNFYAHQSSLTAYDYEGVVISWLAENGYNVGVVQRALSARKMLVETAFSADRLSVIAVDDISGTMFTNWNINYTNLDLSLPSEVVLAYHHVDVPRALSELLPSKHKKWLPLIEQKTVHENSPVTPVVWDSSQQLPPIMVGEEFYHGDMVIAFTDGLQVIEINAVGSDVSKQDLQHPLYVLVHREHLGYRGEDSRSIARGNVTYDQHGQNLAIDISDINWHSHEAAIYLNNYGKQRFFGIKGSEADLYHYNRGYLNARHYDGVFVRYEKNGNMQVGLASLTAPGLLSVQHTDGSNETVNTAEIKDVLIVHHSDYASDGRQLTISPSDMQPLNAETLNNIIDNDEVFEDDMLLARVVLVLTDGWRVVEVSNVQEDDGEIFPLETPILGLVNVYSEFN